MSRYLGPGQILLAAGLAGIGVLSLMYHDFALQWQPVPQGIPAREALALGSGGLLVIAALGLLGKRTARTAALVLALFVFSWVLLLRIPPLIMNPLNIAAWLGLGESLTLTVGAWVLYAWLDGLQPRASASIGAGATAISAARLLLGACMVVFGLAHFAYADFTASMIPAWLPARLPLAYLTGAAHAAAGAALLLGIVPALAVQLEAIMMSAFIVLVHIPAVLAQPSSREQWTALCAATALSGAVWVVFGSFRVQFRQSRP